MLDQWYQSLGFALAPTELIQLAALVFARSMLVLFFNPFLGGQVVPGPVKMATSFTFIVLLLPLLGSTNGDTIPTGLPYFYLLVKELAIGATLGWISGLIFAGFSAAGRLVDTQRGTNMAETMVFQIKERTSVFGQLYTQTAIVLFLIAGGHLVFLKGFFTSFEVLPVTEFPAFADGPAPILRELARLSADVLVIAVQLSAPALIALFLTDVGFGIINRASPQINVFVVSQPAKVAIGVFMVLLVMRVLMDQFDLYGREMLISFYRFIGYTGS